MRLDDQVPDDGARELGGGKADAVGVEGEWVGFWAPLPRRTTSSRRGRARSITILGPQSKAVCSGQPCRVENEHPTMIP
jgi:hypothetical protein